MKAIQTEYKGYLFRSRLEARWAVFFDKIGIPWEYEPEGLILSGNKYYLPDFYLPEFHCYFEVKPIHLLKDNEGYKAIDKISDGSRNDDWAGIIAFGDPCDDNLMLFCLESDDSGSGNYESEVTIGIHPKHKVPYLFAYTDNRRRSFFVSYDDMSYIPATTCEYGRYKIRDFVNSQIYCARVASRQARFEFKKHVY